MDKRRMNLHQLVYMSVKEALKSEGLIRSELHELTDYILNHSVAQITADSLILTEGNLLGVNSEREIVVPRFLTFDFTKRNMFDMLEGTSRTWKLRSYATFDELQSYVSYATNYPVILIDGAIVSYEVEPKQVWGYEVVWGFDAYIVKYKDLDDEEQQEVLRSKMALQTTLMQLVAEGATEISAYDIIEGIHLDFEVRKSTYSTVKNKVEDISLIWCSDMEEGEEEEMMF